MISIENMSRKRYMLMCCCDRIVRFLTCMPLQLLKDKRSQTPANKTLMRLKKLLFVEVRQEKNCSRASRGFYKFRIHNYKVQLHYYNLLLRTTKYYTVLHNTIPVLLCTTKYYSSTILYYKVLLCTIKY